MNSPAGFAVGAEAPACPAVVAESLVGLLAARVAATPARPALAVAAEQGLRTWSWAELAAAAMAAADAFVAAGLRRGDRLAHVGPHGPDWLVIDLACLVSGVVHVPLHADATPAEHERQLAWLEPRAVVSSGPARAPWLAAAAVAGRIVIVSPAGGWLAQSHAADNAARLATSVAAADPDACATIVLSSGTTGTPHGVVHSQRALASNARAVSDMFLSDPRDVRLAWLPASHLLARVGDLYTAIERGG